MTHAEFEMELVEALNMLLEDERASVEMEVALASGATEYGEREALAGMGAEDIMFCEQLRTEMEQAGLPVSPQINGIVFQVIGAERYDDRLRGFAHHQRVVAEHARELQESNLEGGLRDALEGITLSHTRHTEWTEQRASAFAATRMLEFGANRSVIRDDAPALDDSPTTEREAQDPTNQPVAPFAEEEHPEARDVAPEDLHDTTATMLDGEPTPHAETAAAAPKPRTPRATRATAAANAAKATPKARAKATTAAKSAPKPKPKPTPTPRRVRSAPTDGETSAD